MKMTKFLIGSAVFIALLFVACAKEEVMLDVSDFFVNIDENPINGKVLGKITATTNKGELEYGLTAQSPAGALAVDASTGELVVLDNTLFDYETRTSLIATVTVTNSGVAKSGNIVITLNDVNENTGGGSSGGGTTGGGNTGGGSGIITASNFMTSIAENPSVGQSIGTVSATTTGSGQLTYSISNSGANGGAITINSSTGELTVGDVSYFDFETRSALTAVVTVTEGTNSQTLNVIVNLTDVKADATTLGYLTKTWETSSLTYAGINATSMVHSCRLDDAMTFNSNGTYTYDGGASLCGGEDSQTQKTGTWDLDENVNFIIFDKGTLRARTVTVDLLTNTNFNLSGTHGSIPFSGQAVPR